MSQKPHPSGVDVFSSGEIRKSFSAHSLNKVTRTSGGGSGFRSEARKPVSESGKFRSVGDIQPSKVTKTTIHYNSKGEKKAMSKQGYIVKAQAFIAVPFVFKVVYEDRVGNTMTVFNTNIR
jgi:hypothetical protein